MHVQFTHQCSSTNLRCLLIYGRVTARLEKVTLNARVSRVNLTFFFSTFSLGAT